jgi:hypothetical protein
MLVANFWRAGSWPYAPVGQARSGPMGPRYRSIGSRVPRAGTVLALGSRGPGRNGQARRSIAHQHPRRALSTPDRVPEPGDGDGLRRQKVICPARYSLAAARAEGQLAACRWPDRADPRRAGTRRDRRTGDPRIIARYLRLPAEVGHGRLCGATIKRPENCCLASIPVPILPMREVLVLVSGRKRVVRGTRCESGTAPPSHERCWLGEETWPWKRPCLGIRGLARGTN